MTTIGRKWLFFRNKPREAGARLPLLARSLRALRRVKASGVSGKSGKSGVSGVSNLFFIAALLLLLICSGSAAFAASSLNLNDDGTVRAPRNFWQANKVAINLVVDHPAAAVDVDESGVVVAPQNFWTANRRGMLDALGGSLCPIGLDENGRVVRPYNFWWNNREAINAVVECKGGVPVPRKILLCFHPPFGQRVNGYWLTDFKVKARDPQGNLRRLYMSTDPLGQIFTDAAFTKRPIVRFTWPRDPAQGDRWHVQGNAPIFNATGGLPVGGFVMEIDAGEVSADWEWTVTFLAYDYFLNFDGVPVYFPVVPVYVFDSTEDNL